MNDELRTLYEQDQADRREKLPADLGKRDAERRQRVEELIEAGALQAAVDYYHAAMVFQHGGTPEYSWQAHELAKQAVEMSYEQARWLTAAAYDRWLMQQGRPQKYGTQYIPHGTCWKLWPIDPTTTDIERAEWNVPTLEETMQHVADLCANPPQQL